MLFEVEQAANRIRAEVDPDANIIFGNTILDEMEGRIRVSVVATGIDADQVKMPLPTEKVRPLHPHLNLKSPARVAQPVPVAAAHSSMSAPQPVTAAATFNPVHATMDALAHGMGADKSPAEDYILGGEDAPVVEENAARYPAVESYRPLETQPLAPRPPEAEKKAGWGFFGRKKPAADMRAEPVPEPRMAQPRATAQPMTQATAPVEPPRGNGEDLFPDHKRDEQFEIPAFLRRQSN
jgi:cell division protein FtsZ